eukprot:scaffold421_cov125-Isochrysis_galbana.AAC.5
MAINVSAIYMSRRPRDERDVGMGRNQTEMAGEGEGKCARDIRLLAFWRDHQPSEVRRVASSVAFSI